MRWLITAIVVASLRVVAKLPAIDLSAIKSVIYGERKIQLPTIDDGMSKEQIGFGGFQRENRQADPEVGIHMNLLHSQMAVMEEYSGDAGGWSEGWDDDYEMLEEMECPEVMCWRSS